MSMEDKLKFLKKHVESLKTDDSVISTPANREPSYKVLISYLQKENEELLQENVDLREHLTIMYVDKFNQKVKLENKAKAAWMDGYDIGAADEREVNQVGDPSEY